MDAINKWSFQNIPSQVGRVAVVTGATQGLGLVVARELANAGAEVIVPARSKDKGESAVRKVMSSRPRGSARYELLDLTSLDSVRDFAQRLRKRGKGKSGLRPYRSLGILIAPEFHSLSC